MSPSQKLYDEALALYKKQKLSEAVEKLEFLVQQDPSFEDAHEALAILYQRADRIDDAIETAKKWIRLNPLALMAHTNLSRFYMEKGMIAEAEHEQGEARRLGWIEELKQKKMALPKVDPKAKIERFKKVIDLDPKDVLGYYSLGEAYVEAGMHREAVEIFTKGLAVDPSHTSSYLGLGSAFQALGENEKAKEIFRKGIEVADSHGDLAPLKKMQARLAQLSQ